jgi:hypothetical protein
MSRFDDFDSPVNGYMALFEKAALAGEDSRVRLAVEAVRAMFDAGADAFEVATAREYVKRQNLMSFGSFDNLVRAVLKARKKSSRFTPTAAPAHLHTPPPIASDQDILGRVVVHLGVCRGLVGERGTAQLIYLAFTSRLLPDPVNVAAKGLSSSGKSYTIESVATLMPPEALFIMTAMSERALIYLKEPLKHRTLVLYEAAALREGREKVDDNMTAYIVRSLLSEGEIRYPVVIKDEEGLHTETILIEGPTNLITSTTSVSLHSENETRMLSLPSDDSRAQTRAVMIGAASERKRGAADLDPWHDLQRWLAQQSAAVTIPYAACVAAQIPPIAVRLRRDWNAVRSLIRSHALLHQLNRDRNEDGAIVADLTDYTVVRSLVNDLVADAIGASVPASVRETIEVVQGSPSYVTVHEVAQKLGIERSSAQRRLHTAAEKGYITNVETKRGRPARYVIADGLPETCVVLPLPEDICTSPCTHTSGDIFADQDGAE